MMLQQIRLAAKYILVRASITCLRAVCPLSFIYLGGCIVFRPRSAPRLVLAGYATVEALFYLVVYLPLQHYLQKPAIHPQPLTRAERRMIFKRCTSCVQDPEAYLRGWFSYSDLDDVKQENIREFFAWSFWNAEHGENIDEEEMREYVHETEILLGRAFAPGRGKAKCLRITIDRVDMLHRPLLWYAIIGAVDMVTSCRMWFYGFAFYRQSVLGAFKAIPPRVLSLLARRMSPSTEISYWYRPHKAQSKLPVLYIHGIGVGLLPYVDFLHELASLDPDIGIIAVELMPISARIMAPQLLTEDLRAGFLQILQKHGWDDFVLASNSYGTFVTTQIFRSSAIRPRISKMVLIDPVSFLLHLPDVAYNVTARVPRKRTEWTLWYFSAKDMFVSHTLHRRSFWIENIMWKDDVQGMDVTICLAGRDIVVNSEQVGRYLFEHEGDELGAWKVRPWAGIGLDLIWFPESDHADVFEDRRLREKVIKVLAKYTGHSRANGNVNEA